MTVEKQFVPYPLSREEHAAMARYVARLRQQLQEVSELFGSRYGTESTLGHLSAKTLLCATLLEHELLNSEPADGATLEGNEASVNEESAIV